MVNKIQQDYNNIKKIKRATATNNYLENLNVKYIKDINFIKIKITLTEQDNVL